MAPLVNRWIVAGGATAEQAWQLLAWCLDRGASEFALEWMSLEGSPAPMLARASAALAPFRVPAAPRERLTVLFGEPRVQSTELFALTHGSIRVLRQLFSDGLFDYPTHDWDSGWFEDPTFYRSGAVMFGVVSHECEAILRITEQEVAQVTALGIQLRDRPEWT